VRPAVKDIKQIEEKKEKHSVEIAIETRRQNFCTRHANGEIDTDRAGSFTKHFVLLNRLVYYLFMIFVLHLISSQLHNCERM
jgi:hypothetical protein